MNAPHTAAPLVSRTMRAAVKIGDDYYTVEETIALLPTASDEQIREAVATGLRIYEAQRAALDEQIAQLRSGRAVAATIREPDAPASEKQRGYLDYLLKELSWDAERLASFAAERSLDLATLTKREASELIDQLKGVLAGIDDQTVAAARPDQADDAPLFEEEPSARPPAQLPIGERATPRQVRALERLVEERGIDREAELRARFGERGLADLSMDEAGTLLSEWQQRPRVARPPAR